MGTTDWKVAPSLIREQWRRRAEINSGVVVKWSVASAVGFDYETFSWLNSRTVSGRQGQRLLVVVARCSSGRTGIKTVHRQQGRIDKAWSSTATPAVGRTVSEASSGWCSRCREAATGSLRASRGSNGSR
ncbi:hypothetical protein NL676_019839 [Syzygium grande]|nr:hypothetical protein NL676_019839 [Syzygium grande]